MEASVIFVLASIYGLRAGAVCAVVANRETEEFVAGAGVENAVKVANEAVKILYEWDEELKKHGRRFLSPSIIREFSRR